MKRRICIIAGPYDVTLAVSNGLAAWSREHEPYRIEVLSVGDHSISWLARAGYAALVAVNPTASVQQQLTEIPLPSICVLTTQDTSPSVNLDDEAIGRLGAQHLMDCGYRRFAFYGVDAPWSILRHRAFAATLRPRSFDCLSNLTAGRWPDWDSIQNERRVRRFLKKLPKPIAIMACNDLLGRVLADACAELKLNIPDDVAILGVDNAQSLCESDHVTLSSVDTDLERLGHEVGRLLDRAIHGEKLSCIPHLVAPRAVIQRRSTNAAAFEDADIAAAVRFIRENACDGITVDDVCRHLAISRRQLERRFIKDVGELPGAQIRHLRIARARVLLEETKLSLTEIARRCGYEHLSSFSAAFRAATGGPPSVYRRDA